MNWNVGNPPSPGWYAAKKIKGDFWHNAYRWWDGRRWSWPAFPHENSEKAGRWAQQKEPAGHNSEIMWGCK